MVHGLLEKIIVVQMITNLPAFMKHEGSLLCSQKHTIQPCPEKVSSSYFHNLTTILLLSSPLPLQFPD